MINAILQLRPTVSLSFDRGWQFCGKIFFECITNHFRKLSISTKAFDYHAIGLFTFVFFCEVNTASTRKAIVLKDYQKDIYSSTTKTTKM